MKIAVAFDHRGVALREAVLEALADHDVIDLGTDSDAVRIDYPDKSREVGERIQSGEAERGVLVCGSGVGAAVAACKLAGIRAAICHDVYSAHQGVEHDGAGRGGAEAVERDRVAAVAHPLLPAERDARLDRETGAHVVRQHLLAVVRVLELEELPARHRHDPHVRPVVGRATALLERVG